MRVFIEDLIKCKEIKDSPEFNSFLELDLALNQTPRTIVSGKTFKKLTINRSNSAERSI